MKRKGLLYILLAIAAIAIATYTVMHFSTSTLSEKDSDFAVKDTSKISLVTLTDKKGHVLKLERTANGWKVNNKFTAANYMITQLLSTLYNITVKYPVMEPAYHNIVKEMAGTAIEVDIQDAKQMPIKTIYIGGPDLTSTGTFTKMAGSNAIYATCLPGFEGYLTTRFSTDEADWRDKHLFDIKATDIRRIIVAYPSHPDSSFQVDVLSPDSFILYNYKQQPVPAIRQKVVLYLLSIGRLQCEAIINSSMARDTTVQQKPFCIVTIVGADSKPHTATFFRKGVTRTTQAQVDPKTNTAYTYDIERALALINNNNDFVLVQYHTIDRLIRHLSDFTNTHK